MNDYNLNISRYVDMFEEEAEIDIRELQAEIGRMSRQLDTVEYQIEDFLHALEL